MTLKITVLKNSFKDAFIKVSSDGAGDGEGTLDLESLCYDEDGNQFLEAFSDESRKFKVGIMSIQWSGELNSKLECKRGEELVFNITSGDSGNLDFFGGNGYVDYSGGESEFKFNSANGKIHAWIALRKINYKSLSPDARDE